jgi:hypothetical protein
MCNITNITVLCARARKHAVDADLIFNAIPAMVHLGERRGRRGGKKKGGDKMLLIYFCRI